MHSPSLLSGEKTCTVWSDVGSVARHGSSFRVYCSFKCATSMISMHCYDPKTHESTEQLLEKHNSTTVYFKVYNITGNQTYRCSGVCHTPVDDCGLDMEVGCKCGTHREGQGGLLWSFSNLHQLNGHNIHTRTRLQGSTANKRGERELP